MYHMFWVLMYGQSCPKDPILVYMQAHSYQRPGTLDLHNIMVNSGLGDSAEQARKRPELTNFNADKFIADLPFRLAFLL